MSGAGIRPPVRRCQKCRKDKKKCLVDNKDPLPGQSPCDRCKNGESQGIICQPKIDPKRKERMCRLSSGSAASQVSSGLQTSNPNLNSIYDEHISPYASPNRMDWQQLGNRDSAITDMSLASNTLRPTLANATNSSRRSRSEQNGGITRHTHLNTPEPQAGEAQFNAQRYSSASHHSFTANEYGGDSANVTPQYFLGISPFSDQPAAGVSTNVQPTLPFNWQYPEHIQLLGTSGALPTTSAGNHDSIDMDYAAQSSGHNSEELCDDSYGLELRKIPTDSRLVAVMVFSFLLAGIRDFMMSEFRELLKMRHELELERLTGKPNHNPAPRTEELEEEYQQIIGRACPNLVISDCNGFARFANNAVREYLIRPVDAAQDAQDIRIPIAEAHCTIALMSIQYLSNGNVMRDIGKDSPSLNRKRVATYMVQTLETHYNEASRCQHNPSLSDSFRFFKESDNSAA